METNPARNSQLETYQDDDSGSRLRAASFSLIHRIERSPHALENSRNQFRPMLRVSVFGRTVLVFHSPMRNGVVCADFFLFQCLHETLALGVVPGGHRARCEQKETASGPEFTISLIKPGLPT